MLDHPYRRRRIAAIALTAALGLAACASGDDDAMSAAEDTAEESGGSATIAAGGVADEGGLLTTGDAAESPDRAVEGEAEPGGAFDIGVIGRDVIIEMRVVLSSSDIQRTVASIMANASTLGGGVASSDVNYGESGEFGSEGFAVLVVKVPPESVDRLLAGLDDTADVQSINQSAQDVTEQLVDLDVRIQNARQSVANVREFMDRTENLNELVTLEAELTRRQTDLERLEAQQRNLADRVALSTVTIEVVPSTTVPDVGDVNGDGDDTIGDALRGGWDAFTALLFGIGFVIAATLPFLVTAVLLGLVAWLAVRRRDAMRTPALDGRARVHGTAPVEQSAGPVDPVDVADEPEREPEPTS